MAIQFPVDDYFEKLADAEFKDVKKYGPHLNDLPNRFIHYPDWYNEFGRWVRNNLSPYCYRAWENGGFNRILKIWFHEGRSPIYAYFKAAKS